VVAQLGGWIVKLRSTSAKLDPAGHEKRMDAILAALKANRDIPPAHPLILPGPCPAERDTGNIAALLASEPEPKPKSDDITLAALLISTEAAAVHGAAESLAANPEKYCRGKMQMEQPIGALYRPLDASRSDWTILAADSGRSLSGLERFIMKEKNDIAKGGMLTANKLDQMQAIIFFKAVPAPDLSFQVGFQALLNPAPFLVASDYKNNITIGMEEKK
jgi:hypothetical protein